MAPQSLSHLAAWLASDPTAAFGPWRGQFLDALDQRRLRRCRRLLAMLQPHPAAWMAQAQRHYRAVLASVEQEYDRAETLLRDLLAEALTPMQRIRTVLVLAVLLDEQGEWDEADRLYAEAAAGYTAAGDILGEAKLYNNWGISLCYRCEQGAVAASAQNAVLAAALSHLERAQAQATAAGEEGERELAKFWHSVGKVYGRLGLHSQAEAALERYLRWSAEADNDAVRGYTLVDLAALVYLPQARFETAAAALDEAIPLLEHYDDPLNLAEAHLVRGQMLLEQGAAAAALASFEAAIAATESIRSRLKSPTAQIRSRATTDAIYRAPLALHLARGDAAAVFTAAERVRARVLADLLARQAVRPQVTLPKGLAAERARVTRTLDQAYAALEEGNTPALAREIETHERRLAALDQRIERLDHSQAGLSSRARLDTAAVQARLPADAALLTWVAGTEDRIWMLVVTRDDVQMVPAPPRIKLGWLQGYLGEYLDGSRRGSLTPDPVTGALAPLRLYGELYQALVAPVAPLLASANTVYLVPAGPLHYVPLGAVGAPGAEPWTTGRRVVYAPSATVLLDYCHRRAPSPHRGLLALAPNAAHLRLVQPAAAQLVRSVGGTAVAGEAATRQALLRRAPHYRIVCFLGHARFERRYPMSSRLQLADGSLTASEILRSLRLQCDLAILAACETGRGQAPRGDEVLGLSRALLYAGTPSLLVTLWRVHEAPTRLLVERLVGGLDLRMPGTRLDAAGALAAAQHWLRTLTVAEAQAAMTAWGDLSPVQVEELLAQLWQMTNPGRAEQAEGRLFAHPYFWSGYVLIGDNPGATG